MTLFERLLLGSCVGILVGTAVLKLISAGQVIPTLLQPDPLFNTQTRYVIIVGAVFELIVAYLIFRSTNAFAGALLAFMFSVPVWVYRAFVDFSGHPQPCPCLGYAGQWMGLSPRTIDQLTKALLVYLSCVPLALLIWNTRFGFRREEAITQVNPDVRSPS